MERQHCKSPNQSLKENSTLYTMQQKQKLVVSKYYQYKTRQELEKIFFYNRINLENTQKINDNDFLQWIEQ